MQLPKGFFLALNFFVNYDLFVYKVAASDAMEEISENVTVKG